MVKTVKIRSTIDRSVEEVFYIQGKKDVPLLVNLHTWSFDKQAEYKSTKYIHKLTGWNVICPEFRGPNLASNPRAQQACGSKLAMQDIVDSVKQIKTKYKLKNKNVFLLGGSGGGMMALMMAGYVPGLWTAVCAWCPITDLNRWRFENNSYRKHIEACCKGDFKSRSPVSYINKIAKAAVFIFHGKNDLSVPYTQSLNFYNQLIKKYPVSEIYLYIFKGAHEINIKESIKVFKTFLIGKKLKVLKK